MYFAFASPRPPCFCCLILITFGSGVSPHGVLCCSFCWFAKITQCGAPGIENSINLCLQIFHGAHGTLEFSILNQDARVHAHTHTHARTHTRARVHSCAHTHAHSRTCANTPTHTLHTPTRAHTHTRARTCTLHILHAHATLSFFQRSTLHVILQNDKPAWCRNAALHVSIISIIRQKCTASPGAQELRLSETQCQAVLPRRKIEPFRTIALSLSGFTFSLGLQWLGARS